MKDQEVDRGNITQAQMANTDQLKSQTRKRYEEVQKNHTLCLLRK